MLHGCRPRASPGITRRARLCQRTRGCHGLTRGRGGGDSIFPVCSLGKERLAGIPLSSWVWVASSGDQAGGPYPAAAHVVALVSRPAFYAPRPGRKRFWACPCCISRVAREPAPGCTGIQKPEVQSEQTFPALLSTARAEAQNLAVFLWVG